MRFLLRIAQRLAIFALGAVSIWLIVFVVYDFADKRLPWSSRWPQPMPPAPMSSCLTPCAWASRSCSAVTCRASRITADGLPGDPVNLVLIGTFEELRAAFAAAGWVGGRPAQPQELLAHGPRLRARSSPTPPRPSARSSCSGAARTWASSGRSATARASAITCASGPRAWRASGGRRDTAGFWLNTDRPDTAQRVLWVGAGTKDTGFSLTRLTFQITHATDSDTNAERDYIVEALGACGAIGEVALYQTGDQLITDHVNHYVTDGDVAVAELTD